ncbi:unnamed protein product [Clonostachys solani]|uniref:Uncharacterized protein n=1 Tax=Clonostachys solani TaxID=160281 RepID=A0A9N9YVI2_9HYPO|nr:unnamed protein product [Clonostachys solani]
MGFKTSGPALSSRASAASRSSTTGLKASAVSTASPTATLSTASALSRSAAGFKIATVSTTSFSTSLATASALGRSAAGFKIAFFEIIVEVTLPELLKVPWVDRRSKASSLHQGKLAAGIVYFQSKSLAGETAPDESDKSEMLSDDHFDLIERKLSNKN